MKIEWLLFLCQIGSLIFLHNIIVLPVFYFQNPFLCICYFILLIIMFSSILCYFILFYFILFYLFFQRRTFCLVYPGWSAMAGYWLTATLASWVQAILLSQPPEQLGLQAHATIAQLTFVFLVEMGFHHAGQTGLGFLMSSDLPALASQSAGITGLSHCTWPPLRNF